MMLKAKQAKLKWCILGVVAQSKAGINLASGQRLWISCYTPFRAVSERNLATRLRVVSVWPICWRLLISVSFFPMLRGWSGPKWWWLSAEITNMRWTLMPAGLRGGHQAKLDVKAGKIYVVLYFPGILLQIQWQKLCEMTSAIPKFICSKICCDTSLFSCLSLKVNHTIMLSFAIAVMLLQFVYKRWYWASFWNHSWLYYS